MTRLRPASLVFEVVLAALAVAAVVPLWAADHPPIQDLPQHLAAIRVLHDYGDPALALERYFDVELLRTQYLAWYLAADLLAYVFGVALANKLLLTTALIGTPYAMRFLLRALGRDERLCLFVLPLTWNAHLILGFLNFIGAIPLSLAGLALAVRLRERWTTRRAVALAAVAVVAFYTHVVPFAFLALGAALVAIGEGPRETFRRWLPLAPAALAMLIWSQTAPAGQSTLTAALLAGGDGTGPEPQFVAWMDAIREAPMWLTDTLHSEKDDRLLVVWALLVMVAFVLGAARRADAGTAPRDALMGSLTRRIGLLAPLAALAYFVTPGSYDWIWPINARFPLLALTFLVVAIPTQRRLPGLLVLAGVVLVSVLTFSEVTRAFVAFDTEEVGELDEAIATIPEGQRVAGLVFDRGSREVKFSPFIHAVAWYQAERGGAVMFTFADFPQSPFMFKEADRPPRVPPRWEWMPERVDPRTDLAWYDWVLVRGGPGRIAAARDVWEPVFRSAHWSVWKRMGAEPR